MLKTVHVHYRIHDFPTHEHLTTHRHTHARKRTATKTGNAYSLHTSDETKE